MKNTHNKSDSEILRQKVQNESSDQPLPILVDHLNLFRNQLIGVVNIFWPERVKTIGLSTFLYVNKFDIFAYGHTHLYSRQRTKKTALSERFQ